MANIPPSDLQSRTRPGRLPDPDVSALRALKRATDDYLTVLEAVYSAMGDHVIAGKPEMAYLRSAIAVASGHRGAAPFATPIGMRNLLSKLLGEETTS